MNRKASYAILAGIIALMLLAAPAAAQGPVVPQHSDPAWQAYYWNNTDLSGPAAVQRGDTDIDFDWGNGSPDPGIASDGFSARWTRYIDTAGGTYRFTATSDDGIRISIDGRWIINQWFDHAAQTFTADVRLDAGHHLVVVEYYENGGGAVARVSWAPAGVTVSNWRGEYFTNKILSGSPALVRDDADINFNWGTGSPGPGVIGADNFSVRWTRTLNMNAGSYRFSATADDGVRVWVNNHLLIDVWQDQSARTYSGDIYLPGGQTTIRMEYYDSLQQAVARLTWSGGGTQPPPPPPPAEGTTVDDGDGGFVQGGTATSWRRAGGGFGDDYTWTRNNDRVRANYNWARWYPDLAPGRYELMVYVPAMQGATRSARYWVSHSNGYTQRIVDQSTSGGGWVSLGTYWFSGTERDYLSLADVTYEPYLSRTIVFDAARWAPR